LSARSLYLTGAGSVAALGALAVLLVGPETRPAIVWGLAIAFALQAPLGWWTVRSIGRPQFQLVWSAGMLIRLTVVALAALILAPAFDLELSPLLGSLVAAMAALLIVEALTAMREHTWERG
jgi:heme A synthase